MDALLRHGADEKNIDIVRVPGAFEIPLVAKKLAGSGKYHAVICLGAVIRGATPHFEYVAAEVSKGIAQVNLETEIPVTFGVLTTDNIEQAIERAGTTDNHAVIRQLETFKSTARERMQDTAAFMDPVLTNPRY